ncbi:MAG: hypothetical protein JWN57_2230 [Frankiales bacterium]|nr:hypothetical protein [Frankiales bacterium]
MTDLLSLPRAAAATALGLATALRGARVFHPHGQTYVCTVVVAGGAFGASLLDEPGEHDGFVRFSRGAGLPRPLPDVDGFALRLPGLGVDGEPLDILINSAWRYAFVPSVVSRTWSAVLPHRTGSGQLVLLGARPTRAGFTLLGASPLGVWRPWGRLELGAAVDGEDLRFRPERGAPDLQPVELFRTLRSWAYDASQAGRS